MNWLQPGVSADPTEAELSSYKHLLASDYLVRNKHAMDHHTTREMLLKTPCFKSQNSAQLQSAGDKT